MLAFDQSLFDFIQHNCHTAFLDTVLPFWREKLFWVPAYLFLASFLLLNYGRKGFLVLLLCAATVAFSDTISSKIIKPMVGRERPCQVQPLPHPTAVECGVGKSFPSSHAANHFALAVFVAGVLRRKLGKARWWLFAWAASIGFSQIYVGVHYPLDVLAGSLLGALIGWIILKYYWGLKRYGNFLIN